MRLEKSKNAGTSKIFAILLIFVLSSYFIFSVIIIESEPSAVPEPTFNLHPEPSNLFLPGSLVGKRVDILQKCHVNLEKYKKHRSGNMCTLSKKFNLFYLLLPKSGSSTGRHVMKHDFEAQEHNVRSCKSILRKEDKSLFKTVSLRNPVSRFYASYDEMFVRRLPHIDAIPAKYRGFMNPYRGFVYTNYSDLFYFDEGINRLTDTFEQFVHDYDGLQPFDEHLKLQMPSLVNTDGFVHPFDYVIDTKNMDTAFQDIANIVGNPKKVKVIRGRSYPRRFNTSRLSKETYQKICELSLIDFCCLNYPLPEQCIEAGKSRTLCAWEKKTDPSTGEMKKVIVEKIMEH